MLMINDEALAERFGPASEIRLPISQLLAIVSDRGRRLAPERGDRQGRSALLHKKNWVAIGWSRK
jgi:hypothetical protein